MTEATPLNSAAEEGNQSNNQEEEDDDGGELRRGPWTLEEDTLLIHYISCHGEGRWNLVAKSAGLKRTGKSCRLRWLNYLKPDIKRGNLTPQEQLMILELHSKWGNRWSRIAQHLPGRTDNEIKNYWRTRVQKQARQLNMESNSQSFVDAIKCFYMPRLVQKIEQTSSASSTVANSGPSPPPPTQNTTIIRQSPQMSKIKYNQSHLDEENPLNGGSSGSCMSCYSQLPVISDDQHQSCSLSYPAAAAAAAAAAAFKIDHSTAAVTEDDCYYVDSHSTVTYDKDEASMSAGVEGSDVCIMGDYCQWASGNDWFADYMADDGMWNLDQLWHFRK